MTIQEHNILVEKAKNKNNGIFKYKSYYYKVKDKRIHSFCEKKGAYTYEVFLFGRMNLYLGNIEWDFKHNLSKFIKDKLNFIE